MYKLEKYMSEINVSKAIDSIRRAIEELQVNMISYDGQCIVQTLIGSGAGQNASKEFLELVNAPEDGIKDAEQNYFVEDMAMDYMNDLMTDLTTMCEENDFDLGEYNLYVGFNENDGAIELYVVYTRYDEIDILDEEEYVKRKCIAEHFGCSVADVVDIDDDRYQVDGREYLIVDDDTADTYAREHIEDTLWAYRPSFLSGETGIAVCVYEAIAGNERYDENNEALKVLIEGTCGMDDFVDSAISADGRGQYLSPYNGEEIELDIYGETYYAYRLD
jgi:hypothetical protein